MCCVLLVCGRFVLFVLWWRSVTFRFVLFCRVLVLFVFCLSLVVVHRVGLFRCVELFRVVVFRALSCLCWVVSFCLGLV